jgi:uncharacterized protein (TIGR02118 family)
MTAKLIALWGRPKDAEGFDHHYRTVHLELVKRWPNLQSYTVTRLTGSPTGGEVPYYQIFEATFPSEHHLEEALRSPAMADAGKDAMDMVRRYGATLTLVTGTVAATG